MISSAGARIEPGGVLREVRSAPPLTLRQIVSEDDDTCALCLVGSAAGPLAGDDLTLNLDIAAGAAATLVATGAMIAQGGGGAPATLRVRVNVGAGASLDAEPGALIVCVNARVDVSVSIELAGSATVRWRELVVLGRADEPGGAATIDWDVRRAGRPLLRQRIDLSTPALTAWPGQLGAARLISSELRVGPAVVAATKVHGPNHVTQKLADNATLTTGLFTRD